MTEQRWGLTLPLFGLPLPDHAEHARNAEAAGYTDLWSGETQGPDGFTPLALAACWTERARLGTGVVGVQSTLNEAYTSMQTGVYEGWVMFTDASMAFKLNEVSKQYVDMDFGCISTPVITMNNSLRVNCAR